MERSVTLLMENGSLADHLFHHMKIHVAWDPCRVPGASASFGTSATAKVSIDASLDGPLLLLKQYILAPFKENHHWMLVVICIQRVEALFFNSLEGGLGSIKVKGALSVTYRILNLYNGSRKSLH